MSRPIKQIDRQSIKTAIGLLFLFIIPAITILLWSLSYPLSYRFSNTVSTLISLGQITGLTGVSLFSLTMLLNTRLPVLENIFGGLNKVFPVHHWSGRITFLLLLCHPLLLAGQNLSQSFKDFLLFFIPGNILAVNYGIFALLLLFILMLFTMYIKLAYHGWKFLHRFMGVPYALAAIHVLTISSDVARNQPLKIYIICLLTIGFGAYLYRTVLGRYLVKRYPYKLSEIKWHSPSLVNLTFTPVKNQLKFTPGQFVFVHFTNSKIGKEQHPFSITSSPQDSRLSVAVKVLGDYTEALKLIKKGDLALIEGPYGKFGQSDDMQRDQIWIAGGIGITPFISITKSLSGNTNRKTHLYYVVKNHDDAIFSDDLQKIENKLPNFTFTLWYSRIKGRLDAATVNKLSGNLVDKEILISGPVGMIKSMRQQFIDLGISPKQIYSEEFQLV